MIPLQLDLLSKSGYLLKGPGIGESDGRLVGKRSEPIKLVLLDAGATENAQDA
jgi:hypothetical protein